MKIKSTSYKRYEELLYKKESLLKEANKYKQQYEAIFNPLIKEINEIKIDCIRKRKILSYYKSTISQGKQVIQQDLDSFINKAMEEYYSTLEYLSYDEKDVIKIEYTLKQQKNIKTTYHKLAKLIHPDLNNKLKEDLIIQDLWNRICIAHSNNNLEELEELTILVNNYLQSINEKHFDIEIDNINDKISNLNKKIYTITNSIPYQYKYILEDKKKIDNKKEELNSELNEYKLYNIQLDEELASLKILTKNYVAF